MQALTIIVTLFCVLAFPTFGQNPSPSSKQNKIDRIRSEKDVEELLEEIDSKRFEIFSVDPALKFEDGPCAAKANATSAKSWVKADIDGNGFTDLLVNGRDYTPESLTIMAVADNSFVVRVLTRRLFEKCGFATLSDGTTGKVVKYYRPDSSDQPITLTYLSGDFFELNETPSHHTIERIAYSTSGCFGTCPIFELDVRADRTATFNALSFNKRKGKFKSVVSKVKFDELIAALNYIDFPKLSDRYSVAWTDDQSSVLKITYDGGQTKTISDYGLIGTFGLSSFYQLLFDLRENQDWKK